MGRANDENEALPWPRWGRRGPDLLYREAQGAAWALREPRGWTQASLVLSRRLSRAAERGRIEWLSEEEAESHQRKSSVAPEPVVDVSRPSALRRRWSAGWLRRVLSPPLGYGASRTVKASDTRIAREWYSSRLGPRAAARVEEEAEAGWRQNRERIAGFEQRAGYFLGSAGIAAAFLLSAADLVVGDDTLSGGARLVAAAALVITVISLVACSAYAAAAAMWPFGQPAPDNTARVLERSKESSDEDARRARAAALMASRRRASSVAAWKLARLRRAAICFDERVVRHGDGRGARGRGLAVRVWPAAPG